MIHYHFLSQNDKDNNNNRPFLISYLTNRRDKVLVGELQDVWLPPLLRGPRRSRKQRHSGEEFALRYPFQTPPVRVEAFQGGKRTRDAPFFILVEGRVLFSEG